LLLDLSLSSVLREPDRGLCNGHEIHNLLVGQGLHIHMPHTSLPSLPSPPTHYQ